MNRFYCVVRKLLLNYGNVTFLSGAIQKINFLIINEILNIIKIC